MFNRGQKKCPKQCFEQSFNLANENLLASYENTIAKKNIEVKYPFKKHSNSWNLFGGRTIFKIR